MVTLFATRGYGEVTSMAEKKKEGKKKKR